MRFSVQADDAAAIPNAAISSEGLILLGLSALSALSLGDDNVSFDIFEKLKNVIIYKN